MHSISKTYNVRHRVIAVPVCFCEEKIWISLALTHSVCVCVSYLRNALCLLHLLHLLIASYIWSFFTTEQHTIAAMTATTAGLKYFYLMSSRCVCVRLCLCMSYLFRLSIGIFNAFSSSHFSRSCSYNSLKISNDKRGQLQQESEHTRKTRMHHSICSLSSCYFF